MTGRPYGASGDVGDEIAVVRAIYDAFARRDLDAALVHLAEDVELVLPATAKLAGRDSAYHGHDGVRAYVADMNRWWSDLTLHAEDIRAAVGGVVVFGYVEGRVGTETVRRRVLWTWKLRDGLAVNVRVNDLAA